METVVTAIVDELPVLRKKKPLVMLIACAMGFILGFTCVTNVSEQAWLSEGVIGL